MIHITNLQVLKEAHHQHKTPQESKIVLQNPGLSFAKIAEIQRVIQSKLIPQESNFSNHENDLENT